MTTFVICCLDSTIPHVSINDACLCSSLSPTWLETSNKNIKMSLFKSRENTQKKEGGPDRPVSYSQFSGFLLNVTPCFLNVSLTIHVRINRNFYKKQLL